MRKRNCGLVLVVGLLVALGACGGGGKKGKGDLTASGSPTGKIDGPVRIIVAFSKPMVGKDKIDQVVAKPPLELSPKLEGEAKWSDDKTLVFMPSKGLPVSTKFVGTIPGGTKSLDGSSTGDATKFEFFTERLRGVVEVVGSELHAKKDQTVKLAFNHEVAFDQIKAHCGYDGGGGRVGVKLAADSNAGPAKTYAIQPASDLKLNTDYKVGCKLDLKGTVGNLGLEEKAEESFKTYGPLTFVKLDPSGTDIVPDEDLELALAFTNPPAPPYQVKIAPAVPGFPQRCHSLGEQPAGLSCAVLLEANTDYTITIDKSQKDVFGQTLDKPQTLNIRTTNAQPTVSLESGYFVAELKRPVIPVWTRNVSELQVRIVDVTQNNFHLLRPHLDWWQDEPLDMAKAKLASTDKKVAVGGTKNKWGQAPIDPATLLGRKPGPGMYYVEIGSTEVPRHPFKDGGKEKVLVNFTDIGVVSKLSPTRGLVWATSLSTGKPLAGATVSVRDIKGKVTFTGTTDAEGVAVLPGTQKIEGAAQERDPSGDEEDEGGEEDFGGGGPDFRIYVQKDNDWTMINPTRSGGLSPWSFNVSTDYDRAPTKLRGFMHTDRGLYRAGEKVHVKGIARITKLGEPLSTPPEGKKVKVEVEGPQGKTFTETEAKLSSFGGFWFDIDLPGDARLGDYTIRAKTEWGTFTREFSVESYRPATFEVTGKAKDGAIVRKGQLQATIAANYLYGAPVRSGEVAVTVHSRPRRVEFKQHAGFDFHDDRKYEAYYEDSEYSQTMVTEEHAALDQKGNASLSIAVSPNDIYSDSDLLVRATVTAPSNEAISKTFVVPYYRSKRYFGIKAPGYFLDVKKPATFQVVGVAPDGKSIDGTAKLKVTRRDWNCVWEDWGYRGSYQCKDETKTIIDKSVSFVGGKPVEFVLTPETGGNYLITVEGDKDKDESAAAAMSIYAWGDGGGSWRSDDSLTYELVTDKKEYKAGDTATILLKTDLAEATGLVTIERDGVIEKRLISVTPQAKHITVPITANFAPNVYVSVALVQKRMGDGPRGKPRMRMGVVNLPVRPDDNKLNVSVETDAKDYRPGKLVTATVKVTDKDGKPVSAEVSITAADEGVLSLIGYETPNPIPTFWSPWGLGVTSSTQLEFIRDIPGPNVERPATGGDAAGTLRSRFVSTAVWTPGAVTNAQGIATVTFEAPDNLTAFRMMAVAADKGYRFGSADKRFTVSKPLQLHQSLPRFAHLGDQVKGGVVVHNETGKPGTATVKLVTDKRITVAGALEQTVQIGKDANVPVLWDITAADLGESVLGFTVTMNGESDGVELRLPVKHPSPVRMHHVGHGATKDATTLPVNLPADAIASSAELVISVDPDGLSGVEEGLRELVGYPYGCLEQTTSKVIPMLAVRELADSLAIDGLTGPALEGFVKAGVTKIGRHQTAYGGFSLWPGGEPEAYYTAYALWGLHLAKQAGYRVDDTRITDGLEYLKNDGQNADTSRPYYDEAGNLGSQAFALYVRAVLGDKDTQAATTMIANGKLPVYGKAFLARALAAGTSKKDPAVVKLVAELSAIAAEATKKDGLVDEPSDLHGYMSSDLRTTAIVLDTLVALDPKNASIKPLVKVVMKQRRTLDYWDTQENIWSLLALTSYAKSQAGVTSGVTVEFADKPVLANATLAGKQRMRVVTVPIAANGTLAIKPRGEVHYNVEIRHRKQPQTIKAENKGIELTAEYLDENGKPKTSFTVGDVVVVRLATKLKSDANHLIVSAALPAGFEPLNAKFATVGPAVKQKQDWGTFREMYDDRVDFASEYNWYGDDTYEFTVRATSAGKFAKPPTVAELMYEPQTRAQTAFETIEIKAK